MRLRAWRWPHLAACLLLAVGAAGCESVALSPIGRESGAFTPEADERRLWARAQEEQERFERSGHLYGDLELEAYLDSVLHRLVPPEVRGQGLRLGVRVVRNPLLNAFAYPHGAIYVHTGILARMDNEAQLATVLGHELSHATHRHAVRRFRDIQNKAAFATSLQVLVAPFGVYGLAVGVIGTVGAMAAISGYSQEQELEADREGLALMIRAGYDPAEAPKLFGHLQQWVQEEDKPEPFFFGTHPRLGERVDSYTHLLAGEFKEAAARGGRTGTEELLARIRRVVFDNALLDLQAGRWVQTQKALRKHLASAPDDARAYYYLAESHRREGGPRAAEEALPLYAKAIELDGRLADPHRGLGMLYYGQGKRVEAREAFERYLGLAPAAADRAFIEETVKQLGQREAKP